MRSNRRTVLAVTLAASLGLALAPAVPAAESHAMVGAVRRLTQLDALLQQATGPELHDLPDPILHFQSLEHRPEPRAQHLLTQSRQAGEKPLAHTGHLRHEHLRLVLAQARELFSRDAHLKWGRRSMTGAEFLRLQMLIALEALNTRLFNLEALRDSPAQARSLLAAGHAS